MNPELKLAYYRKNDWDKLMNSIVDRESMHDTWEDWNKAFSKMKKSLKHQGFVVHEVTIDIDDLNKFCKKKGLKNNGKTRSNYVAGLPVLE